MSRTFSATLHAADGTDTSITGVMTDEEVVTLNRFLDNFEQLAESRPFREGVPCEVTISVSNGQAQVDTLLPSQDDLDILFQRLRLFVLHQERISFNNVRAILKRHLRATALREFLSDQQKLFSNDPEHLSGRVIFNDVIISDEARLQDWIYGYQFHGDETRRASFEAHGIDPKHPAVRRTFVDLLLNKLEAIRHIAAVTAAVLMGRHPRVRIYDLILTETPPLVSPAPCG